MSEQNGDRLDPEMADLLRRAEPYPDAPREVQLRVQSALLQRIAMTGTAEATAENGHERPTEPPAPSAADGLSTGPATGLLSPNSATRLLVSPSATGLLSLTAKPFLPLVLTFVVGASTGAGLHAVLQPPRERIVYIERPAVTAAPSPATPKNAGAPTNAAPETPNVVTEPPATSGDGMGGARRPSAAPREAREAPSNSDLGAEQTLLDVARAAWARGRADEALGPLDRHARQFPKGILAEEREALAINVLVTLGRYDEARERSARFLRRYPGSLLRASVEAAVEAIP